ncbi:MAG: class II fructose-1,6-bisphosphate aldolase [Clostridia bacterium]|nr:class II fructose-1,6-bisphosphate aldolase [Clostridia bacterium]
MYVSSFEMIKAAREGRYAVPAFNAENMEMVQAIVSAAESVRSPVMIQTTMPTVKYIGEDMAVAMVKTVAERATVPVALHLDHCTSFDAVMRALWAGYTSVMFDGSKMPFEENVALTRKVVDAARPMGVTVEAELGTVGGKEDNVSASIIYTEPEEAEEFVERTGVDILAIAIGTAHGFYKGEPKLDFDRIDVIRNRIDTPLVLHGGSGIPTESVKRAISLGMSKVNFATELRAAMTGAVRTALADEAIIDPKKFMGPGRDAVVALCLDKIDMCGSAGKA